MLLICSIALNVILIILWIKQRLEFSGVINELNTEMLKQVKFLKEFERYVLEQRDNLQEAKEG